MRLRLSRFGARLGNWNDRHSSHDRRADASLRWRVIDRFARWLFVKGDGYPRPAVDELTALWFRGEVLPMRAGDVHHRDDHGRGAGIGVIRLLPPTDTTGRCSACGHLVKKDAYCPCVKIIKHKEK